MVSYTEIIQLTWNVV